MRGFTIFPWLVLATRPFRIVNLYHCLPEVNSLLFVWCVIYSSKALVVPFQLTNTPLPPLPVYLNTLPITHTPLFVNTDYVCGLTDIVCKTKNSAAEYFWRQLLYSICKLYFCILLFWRK